jgi:hypothetical protein
MAASRAAMESIFSKASSWRARSHPLGCTTRLYDNASATWRGRADHQDHKPTDFVTFPTTTLRSKADIRARLLQLELTSSGHQISKPEV